MTRYKMTRYKVLKTREFDKDYEKLDFQDKARVEKILYQIAERGSEIGKPLAGLEFFREKKFNGNRMYFLVYNTQKVVLAAALSDKKAQQATINEIIRNLALYQKYIQDSLNKK